MKDSVPPKKRQRVAQACELCRKKKTKCDGSRPICKNCIQGNHQCVYAHVEKPPPSSGTQRKSSVKRLESRLWRVEQLLESLAPKDLVEKLKRAEADEDRDDLDDDDSERGGLSPDPSARLNGSAGPLSSGVHEMTPISHEQVPAQNLAINQSLDGTGITKSGSPQVDDNVPDDTASVIKFRVPNLRISRETDMTTLSMVRSLGHVYANGPVFTLLSNKGLKWVSEKVGDNSVGVRLYESIMSLCQIHLNMMRPLVCPQVQEYQAMDRELIFGCLGIYALLPQYIQQILPLSELEVIYKAQFVDMSLPPNGYAELLVLNSVTALILLELRTIPEEFLSRLKGFDVARLHDYQMKFLVYSMFYYQRCLNLSPSLTTLCGTLALMTAFHCSGCPHPMDYMVRLGLTLAAEMGLNRKEAYQQGTAQENHRKRLCYWFLYVYDTFISQRTNRSVSTNEYDYTVELPNEINSLDCHCSEHTMSYMRYINCIVAFTKVYSQCYNSLCSPRAQEKHPCEIVGAVIYCDKLLEKWRLSIPLEIRPTIDSEEILKLYPEDCSKFSLDQYAEKLNLLHMIIAYYQLLTSIHKLIAYRPSWIQAFVDDHSSSPASANATPRTMSDTSILVGPNNMPLSASQSLDICSRASRMTLRLFARLRNYGRIYHWTVLHPSVDAFVILFIKCIARPLDPATNDELELMKAYPRNINLQDTITNEIEGFWDTLYQLAHSFVTKARAQQSSGSQSTSNRYASASLLNENLSGPRMPMSAYPTSSMRHPAHILNPIPQTPSTSSCQSPNTVPGVNGALDYFLDANTLESLLQVQSVPMVLEPDISGFMGMSGFEI